MTKYKSNKTKTTINKKQLSKKELLEDIKAIRLYEKDKKKILLSEKIMKKLLGL